MKEFKIIFIAAALMGSNNLFADDFFMGKPGATGEDSSADCAADDSCEAKWDASIEFGYVAVSGNKETDSLNGRFSLNYEIEKWRHGGYLATQSSSSDDKINDVQTDARKLNAQVKSDYKYSDKAYAFGILDYDDTQDSGFDYQSSVAFGGGYSFIKNDTHSLDAELGFGTRESKTTYQPDDPATTDVNEEVLSETNSESISRVAGLYKWQISKTANFEQKLSVELGEDNDVTKSESSLSAEIVENLALKVSYSAKHQSDVPIGNEDTETVSSFTVVYSF